jgi:TonB-dependent starch-binding outer membrane protein SusC
MTRLYLFVRRYLTVLLLFGAMVGFAQGRTVTGKVTSSDDGSGIPGVNILEKGTSNGTVSDVDGNFSISVGTDATLVFSFVGYVTQEVAVGSQSAVNVSMVSDVTALSEVVVVGYGSQDKKEITSSVVSVRPEDFNRGNVNDATQLLAGKVPGLSISKPNSDPNGSPQIRLRGVSTIGANTEPLVVIDGVIGASLGNVDPNDIASIDILKDGSAAAIYGSRGSSGVILITTKKGSKGKLSAEYNGYISSESVAKFVPVLGREEFLALGGNDLGGNTDWADEVTRNGFSNVHNISIGGGSAGNSYRFALNLRDIQGPLDKSGFDQINARINLSQRALKDKLNFSFDLAATDRKSDFSFSEAMRYAVLFNPTAPIFNSDGTFAQYILFDNFNPASIIRQNTNEGKAKRINLSGKVDYEITSGLTATASYALQREETSNGQYYPTNSLFRGFNRNGLAVRSFDSRSFDLFETYLSYTKNLGEINATFNGGYSFQENLDNNTFISTGDFPTDDFKYNRLDLSKDIPRGLATITSTSTPESKIIAFFGRVNLNYKEKLFFNASLRREGSTKLGEGNKWGLFPAVGAGVDITKFAQIPSFNLLKVRVGYGVTGSLPIENGLSQPLFGASFANINGEIVNSFSLQRAANPDLKWETKAETNIGIDMAFLGNRLTASLDVYQRDIQDFILNRTVDASVFGVGNRFENAGKIQTKGIELALGFKAIEKVDFSWSTNLVLSHYKSVLKEYVSQFEYQATLGAPGQNDTQLIRVEVGKEIGQIWGYQFSGQTESGEPLMVAADGTLKKSSELNRNVDGRVLGQGLPDLEIGWTNQIAYKKWDFNLFFRSALGHSLVNTYRAFYEPIIPGQINSYNRIDTKFSRTDITDAKFSSYYVEKGDFVKLDNITIGYNFSLPTGSSVTRLRAYFTAQNPFVVTSYTGVDPEVRLADFGDPDNGNFQGTVPNVLAPGLDRRNNYFRSRTLTLGVTIGF